MQDGQFCLAYTDTSLYVSIPVSNFRAENLVLTVQLASLWL